MAIEHDFSIASNGNVRYEGEVHGLNGGVSVAAGSFVIGRRYVITTVGTTDFTTIGAAENTVGAHFTATGVGTGTGDADTVAPGYYTVIQFHRFLQDKADDAVASSLSEDYMDITFDTPSSRQTDNIIELINGYNIDQEATEHLFDGSIIQAGGADIWDGLVVLAGQGMNLQIIQDEARITNDFWNYDIKGTATGGSGTTCVDSGASFGTNGELVGYYVENTTEGCWGVITSHTDTTLTCSAGFEEGTNQDFAASDDYRIVKGLNSDPVSGYSHRFMLKVRNAGVDIDGKRLIGQSRVWYKTYSEFRIGTGTARGNNVLALTYADDLNNTSTVATAAALSISNTLAGYNAIDVNADTTDEYYYSQWNVNKPTNSINDFYEYGKYLTRQDTASTLYGFNGEVFRGITHELDVDGGTGTHVVTSEAEEITWGTGATAGTGRLLAANGGAGNAASGTTKIWFQLLSGVVPGDNETITGTTSSMTVDAELTGGSLVERTLSYPFIGQSTGSAIIGAYGLGIETDDLTSSDKITALDKIVYTPPNNQNFFVTGLFDAEDYILVGPYDSTTGINYNQMALNTTLNTDNVASVVIGHANGDVASIPSDTPSTGWIRVADDTGRYRRLKYSSWSGVTFTIDTAWHTANDSQNDFGGSGDTGTATAGNNVYIGYIDELASGTNVTAGSLVTGVQYRIVTVGTTDFTLVGAASNTVGLIFTATGAGTGTGTVNTTASTATFQATYNSDRNLWVRARDGGAGKGDTPIKTFESQATFGSAGGNSTVIRTSDA